MVSTWINFGGEFDDDRSDVAQFTKSDTQLADLMTLGEYLGTEGKYVVRKIKFEHNLDKGNEGYFGIKFTCAIRDDVLFEMHLTFARWNLTHWLTEGTFYPYKPSDPQFWPELRKNLETWMIARSPELLKLDHMQMRRIILKKHIGSGTWRVIMRMQNMALLRRLRVLKTEFEIILEVGFFNKSGDLHFSLDTWEGVIPPDIRMNTESGIMLHEPRLD